MIWKALRVITKVNQLNNNILFEPNSFEINPEAKQTLNELADVLREVDNARVHVVGHTDNTGDRAHNQQLSENRAEAVGQYLHKKGVKNVFKMGTGELQPIASNKSEAERRLNRRVEIKIEF